MLEKESFEAQAESVRRVLNLRIPSLSEADQKHLVCAANNLRQMGELRQMVIAQAGDPGRSTVASEGMVEAIVHLLHLPMAK